MGTIRVEALRSLSAIGALRGEIDALNLASRRPCPFSTWEYLETFLAHDEYGTKEDELLFLAAFDADRLVGYLPLRKHRAPIGRLTYGRIGVLVSHDTDRPHVVARAEDEARCCEAFYRHLLDRERGWSLLELALQDAESGLLRVPEISPLRASVRRFANMPMTMIPLPFRTVRDYFASLGSSMRSSLSRLSRRLLAAGRVEVIACADPRARRAMLDLYLDIERRSWKEAAHAGIRRDPRRVAMFEALCGDAQPLALVFDLVLLDDVPIAALVSGAFAGNLYAIEMTFDDAYQDLGPGGFCTFMAMRRAIEARYPSYNFNGNYAYYKARLGGVVSETTAVQIFRVGSLPWLRAKAGELRRRLRRGDATGPLFNPDRRGVATDAREHAPGAQETHEQAHEPTHEQAHRAPGARPPRDAERARAMSTLRGLEAQGIAIDRLSGHALEQALPFTTRKAAA